MKKLTLQDIHKNGKYLAIISTLARYNKGLSLHEIMYLLSEYNLTKYHSKLEDKFGKKNRKNYFNTRQQLSDYLRRLRYLGIVVLEEGIYKFDLPTLFYWCDINDATIEYNRKLKKAKETRRENEQFFLKYPNKKQKAMEELTPITLKNRAPEIWEELKKY